MDALHSLVDLNERVLARGGQVIFVIKGNQPRTYQALDAIAWEQIPVAAATFEADRGRVETRSIQVAAAPAGLKYPGMQQAARIERYTTFKDRKGTSITRSETVLIPVQQAYPRRMGIEVLPATGRWDDFASFMVPRKPGGRGCICIAYRNSSLDMPGRIAHMRALCESEPGPGVLAYVDGEVAGWCSVAPKPTYRALVNSRTIPHVQDEDAWSVVCFVVRPGFRRRGLMHLLLDGAVGHAQAMGATALEGYPVDPGSERIDQTSGYVGTVQLFEAHRFRRVRQTAGRLGGKPRWLVRRELP